MVVLLEVTLNEGLILAYFSILIMALIPIWIGSHLSLTQKAVTFDKTENKLLYSASSKVLTSILSFFLNEFRLNL